MATAQSTPVLILRPSTGFLRLHLRDLWEYRELLYFLVWRDIKVRYKQTALGAAWAILQPVMTMVVFSIFFGRLAKVPSDGVPYPIFAYCALLPWQLFAFALTESSNSLVASQNLITKVYFPRLVIPIASVLAGLVDFAIAFVILLGMMLYYGIVPTAAVALLPLFLLLAVVDRARGRPLVFRPEREVSRRPLHDSVSDSVLDVRHPGRLSQQPGPGALASALRTESHGRRGRRIPLGAPRVRSMHPARFCGSPSPP